tara:strand:+ start:111 stop:398 length:288 start_codon:yes stop_codon:yes gene_type:complete
MDDKEIEQQINDIIEGEIQNSINEYLEKNQEEEKTTPSLGFVPKDEEKKLKVNVSNEEVNKLIKEYKKLKRYRKSNLFQASQLGLVNKNGKPLDT